MLGRFKWIPVGLLLFALLAAGIGGTLVMAQGPTATPTAPSTGGASTPSAPNSLTSLYWQALAQRLGLSVDKLQQTVVDARKDAINQAVKQGLLTQTQAER